MVNIVRIGLSDEERRVMCQAYAQAKDHPEHRATALEEYDLPVWSRVVRVFTEKGYASLRGSSFAQNGGIFWFTPRGMKAAERICENAQDFRELRLMVGSYEEGQTEIGLVGKPLDTVDVPNTQQENEERNKSYTLYDTEEGLFIYEDEWLEIGSAGIDPGQAPTSLRHIQSRLHSIDEARATDSPEMQEVLEGFAEHL